MDIIARTTKQLGAAIRRTRRARKMTQNILGQKMHARQATVSKLEAGEPAVDRKILFKAPIIFWMLGATDGHAKNFSIRLAPGGRFRLTPLYDIISTQPTFDARQIRKNQMKLAMSVGTRSHYVVDTIAPRHFLQTAEQ